MNARRIIAIATLTIATLTLPAGAASAADDEDVAQKMTGVVMTDTHGISVWRFDLAMNDGNRLNMGDTFVGLSAWSTTLLWEMYRYLVVHVIWLLGWILKMDWFQWLLTPMDGLAVIAKTGVDQIGILTLTLAILGGVVGFWLLKGRYAGGFIELFVGCTIAALTMGVLADPMEIIAGDDGMIVQSRDAGMDIATGFATEGQTFEHADNADMAAEITAPLVDVLIRQPHQLLNYGSVIDGTGCEAIYDQNVGSDQAREQIRECDPSYQQVADHPDGFTVISAFALLGSIGPFLLFSVGILLALVASVLLLGWVGISALWKLPAGVAPGPWRGGLYKTGASLVFGCFGVATTSVVVVVWCKFVMGFYSATGPLPFFIRLHAFNILMVMGIIALFVGRHRVSKSLKRTAARLAQMGSGRGAEPAKMPTMLTSAAQALTRAGIEAGLSRFASSKGGKTPPPSDKTPSSAPTTDSATTPTPDPGLPSAQPPGIDLPTIDAGKPASIDNAPATLRSRLGSKLGTAAKLAGHIAAAAGSGGTSAVVTGAKALSTANDAYQAYQGLRVVRSPRSTQNTQLREQLNGRHAKPAPVQIESAGAGVDISREHSGLVPVAANGVASLLRSRLGQ